MLKIKPLNIVNRSWSCYKKITQYPFYTKPKKIEVTLTEAKKHHLLILSGSKNYYSFQLCAMLELFEYDISKITNILIVDEVLTFSTGYGHYQASDLIETDTLF